MEKGREDITASLSLLFRNFSRFSVYLQAFLLLRNDREKSIFHSRAQHCKEWAAKQTNGEIDTEKKTVEMEDLNVSTENKEVLMKFLFHNDVLRSASTDWDNETINRQIEENQ